MKYLKHFESFDQQTINKDEYLYLNKKSLEYLSKLSDVEKINLKKELEKFASDRGLTFDDLKNPEIVTKVLTHESLHKTEKDINEGVFSWLKNNWGGFMRLISKYGSILSIVSFALGLGAFYLTGADTMPIVKASVAAYIISNAAGALSGLG
jgi:hypothetical protein